MLQSLSSCIDLIFTSQPKLVIEAGVHYSLHSSCHHEIVFAKFNLKIWERASSKTDVNEKVFIFNKSVLNVLSNFIVHETIL